DLCVDPCPVDCIDMVPIAQTTSTWKWDFESSPKGDIPIKMVS
ncbi:MAG: electron transport complex subunit RsxB, partial [Pseudomonadota bacterium]|nr:electron transport complex subunit RsxB [Pseudomonadota bacterium]